MKKLIAIILIVVLALPVLAMSDGSTDILGKWSFYWDTRPMNDQYNNGKPLMSFLIHSIDLYFFEDNVAYMTSADMDTKGKFEQERVALDGVWIETGEGTFTANFKGTKYKMELDAEGRLLFYMTESVPYPFTKTPDYDFFAENP